MRLVVVYLLITSSAFVLLSWAPTLTDAIDVSTSSSEYELEVDKFGLTLFVVNPDTRQRVSRFSAAIKLERLMEFVSSPNVFQNPISSLNFSTQPYSTRAYNKTEGSALVRVIDQTTTFPNGVNFTLRIETFNATLNRNYFGWKQRLSPQNIKITYLLEGLDRVGASTRPNTNYQVGVFFSIKAELEVDPAAKVTNPIVGSGTVSSCDYTLTEPVPLIYCGNVRFNDSFVPGVLGNDLARYSQLEIFERRGRLRIIQQRDSFCVNPTGRTYYPLRTARFEHPELEEVQSYLRIVTDILALYKAPDYYGTVSFPGLVAFAPDDCNATAFEYDPDLAGLFSFVEPPAANPAEAAIQAANNLTGAIVGGVVGGLAGIAIIAAVALAVVSPSFRHLISPFRQGTKENIQDDIDLADEGSHTQKDSKRWTRASTPQ